jgi:hypothetical protein
MSADDFRFDGRRQDRMVEKIDEILRRKGTSWELRSRQDVLSFAVQELWKEALIEDSVPVSLLQTSVSI